MSGLPVPTPQLYTIDDVAAVLRADLDARGIGATVEAGEWDPEMHRGEPRVVIGLGDAVIGTPQGHYQPGAWWPVANSTDLARPILDDAQTFAGWVHATARDKSEGEAMGARRATDQLLRATLAALRRQLAAPFREQAHVHWPKPSEMAPGYPAFTYGSFCTFSVVIGSPILDDAVAVGKVASVELDSSVIIDGVPTPPESDTEPVAA